MSAITAASEGVYSNLGGDPLYSNVAEVRIALFNILLFEFENQLVLKLLPSGERGSGALGGA